MSDLERLTEVLERFASMTTPTGMYGSEHDLLVVAARAYRDLLANGERVEWCEELARQRVGMFLEELSVMEEER